MGPKKGQGARGGGAKKAGPAVAGSDHIVFTNKPDNASKPGPTNNEEPAAPRPDARKVIGGASWTGKLPVNLLSELCQREKWNKPDYSMRKLPDAAGGGNVSAVTLSKTNPKTKETTKLPPFQLPPSHRDLASQETPLEARHFAATYALFRVSSMKNIHMTLPPKYRDLWKGEFAQLKDEDVKAGRGWMYDADPFAAAAKTKEIRDGIEARKAKAAAEEKATASIGLILPGQNGVRGKRLSKAWERAPRVEMGNKVRADVEEIVKSHGTWNAYHICLSQAQRQAIVADLSDLGFRRSHVEEAVEQCKDREETLEWLLIHVPEDDLPSWSFPENYTSGISLASGDLAKESKIKRLTLAGYSLDDCAKALREAQGGERIAAQRLQDGLFGVERDRFTPSEDSSAEAWQEELATLESIFDNRYSSPSADECAIDADLKTATISFNFRRPLGEYPTSDPPVIAVHSRVVPAYIRLSATRRAMQYACNSLLGGPMIFNLVEWLETNLPSIIEDPGPLREISQEKGEQNSILAPQSITNRTSRQARRKRQIDSTSHDDLKAAWQLRQSTPAQIRMLQIRQSLPAWDMRERIVDAISSYQCVIISGETGSGKSTQSVQFILDHTIATNNGCAANILCTQPRRISALGLADRVSEERCCSVGDEVGYVIRGEAKLGPKTKITFMTTGVLLRRMQTSADLIESLSDVSHVFVDEVHERSLDTDFLLALLRDVLKKRPDLKVVLMSATLDANIFSSYFGGPEKVAQVHIPGRTYPVIDYYLDDVVKAVNGNGLSRDPEDEVDDDCFTAQMSNLSIGQSIRELGMGINYRLIADLVMKVDNDLGTDPGGILIFLPGTLEIDRCLGALRSVPRIHALPLHASLTPAEQRRVFPTASRGMRKVIASTNVAETSITIADVVAVIDTGRVKETRYDAKDSIVRLEEVWASQAACKQRRGRAGRVQAGTCYKLFTRRVESEMAPRPQPEIRRTPLEQLCLSVKATAPSEDVARFLQQTLTPPDDQAIDVAMTFLHRVGALDSNQLTALGRHLSMIPADLRCAKLMVYGSIFGCLESSLTIAAILTVKSPFVSPRDKRDEAKVARSTFPTDHGDLLLDLSAFDEWSEISRSSSFRSVREWCSEKFLSPSTLRDISSTRSQLLTSLKDASILPLDYGRPDDTFKLLNRDNSNQALLRALIAGALNPQIARIEFPDKKFFASMAGAVELDPEAKTIKYFNQENGRVFVHPSSVLFDAQTFSGSASYVSYFSKMATSKTFIRDLTPFHAYGLLLFGGPITVETHGNGLLVDGWLRLRGWARIGVLVSRLRALLDEALRKRIDQPQAYSAEDSVIGIVRRLVQFNGQDQ
jgi:ATP-dependent RNA helicase DHX57